MASAFWALEDGRSFAVRWTGMAYMLELITDELKNMPEAKTFYEYLEYYVFREELGDTSNGYGGFIRGDNSILFNFDLRSFAPKNRVHFWQAAQKALEKNIRQNNYQKEGITNLLIVLLDMHKRIERGENPMLLNHLRIIVPDPNEQLGPDWSE